MHAPTRARVTSPRMSSFVVCPLQRMVCMWYHHSRRSGTPTRRAIAIINRSSGPAVVAKKNKKRRPGGERAYNSSSIHVNMYGRMYLQRNEACAVKANPPPPLPLPHLPPSLRKRLPNCLIFDHVSNLETPEQRSGRRVLHANGESTDHQGRYVGKAIVHDRAGLISPPGSYLAAAAVLFTPLSP